MRKGSISASDIYSLSRTYAIGRKIGDGAFSVVRLGTHKATGQQVAIKCVRKQNMPELDRENLFKEVEIMKSLNHPFVIQFVEFIEEEDYYYVVLEYLAGGELFERITQREYYTEDVARDCMHIICTGIKYMHDNDIVHRDIKPENLLLNSTNDDASLKIADFGLAAKLTPTLTSLTNPCGTPGYAAPEIIRGNAYSKPVDMWAVGVVAYCILGGYPPFEGDNVDELFDNVLKANYCFHEDFWGSVSSQAKDFIRRLLCIGPEMRMTAEQALHHPWLTVNKDELIGRNLTDNLELLRKYQSVLKFKATATVIVAAQRMKATVRRARRATKNYSSELPKEIRINGKACIDGSLLSPTSRHKVPMMPGIGKSPSGNFVVDTADIDAEDVPNRKIGKKHSSRRILYQPNVVETSATDDDETLPPALMRQQSSKKTLLPVLFSPLERSDSKGILNESSTKLFKKSAYDVTAEGSQMESHSEPSITDGSRHHAQRGLAKVSSRSKFFSPSGGQVVQLLESVPGEIAKVQLSLPTGMPLPSVHINDLKGRCMVEEIVNGPLGPIKRMRSKSNVNSESKYAPSSNSPVAISPVKDDRPYKKNNTQNRRRRSSVQSVVLPKIESSGGTARDLRRASRRK